MGKGGGVNFCTHLCIKCIVQGRRRNATRKSGNFIIKSFCFFYLKCSTDDCLNRSEQELLPDWSALDLWAGIKSVSGVEMGIKKWDLSASKKKGTEMGIKYINVYIYIYIRKK